MWKRYLVYTFVVIIQAGGIFFFTQNIIGAAYTVPVFLLEVLLCILIPVIVMSILFGRTEEYQYTLGMVKGIAEKLWKKVKGA